MNSDLIHLELYTMESGEELMLLSNVLRKAVLLGGHLNKRNLWVMFQSIFLVIWLLRRLCEVFVDTRCEDTDDKDNIVIGTEAFSTELMHSFFFFAWIWCWSSSFFLQTNDFWREAKILSKLRHPNVVDFYGVVPDALGTVTEFMVNGSLRNVLLRKLRCVVYVSVRHFSLCTMMRLFTRSEQNAWPSEKTYHCYGCGIWDGILALQKHSAFWFEMR